VIELVGGEWTFGWNALVAIGTIGLALFAFVQLRAFNRSERRRTQPVVIAHAIGTGPGLTDLPVYVTNEGSGTAFNVRFGVRFDGREFAVGGDRGQRYVVAQGQREPRENTYTVRADVSVYAGTKKGSGVWERRIYWARYENAFGQVWETWNRSDPFGDFRIFPSSRWRRSLNERRQRFGRAWDRKVLSRRLSEEARAAEAGRGLSISQRIRRWFEQRIG
jgi:hypothetical protein